jgi:ribosomal protein S18 acetylase RimI-like enzyme
MQLKDYGFKTATKEDIPSVALLLQNVFRPTYGKILSEEQIVWMLENNFSQNALLNQYQQENFRFILLLVQQDLAGFAVIEFDCDGRAGVCKLHKLYLSLPFQGRSLGKALIEKAMDTARSKRQHSFLLNVNRSNKAKDFYKKLGFQIIEKVDIPLANGYFMNDYIMTVQLKINQ